MTRKQWVAAERRARDAVAAAADDWYTARQGRGRVLINPEDLELTNAVKHLRALRGSSPRDER